MQVALQTLYRENVLLSVYTVPIVEVLVDAVVPVARAPRSASWQGTLDELLIVRHHKFKCTPANTCGKCSMVCDTVPIHTSCHT